MTPHDQPSRKAEAGLSLIETMIRRGTSAIQASGHRSKSGKDRTRRMADPAVRDNSARVGTLARANSPTNVGSGFRFDEFMTTASCTRRSLTEEAVSDQPSRLRQEAKSLNSRTNSGAEIWKSKTYRKFFLEASRELLKRTQFRPGTTKIVTVILTISVVLTAC